MITSAYEGRSAQRGVVLISSLLLLIVVTIIALSMFRSFGIQGENRRQHARKTARAAGRGISAGYTPKSGSPPTPEHPPPAPPCSTPIRARDRYAPNPLPAVPGIDVAQVPWKIAGQTVGTTVLPTTVNMQINNSTTLTYSAANVANPSYFGTPTFYISDLGVSTDTSAPGELYQIDAFGYGGSQNTVASG